MSSRIISIGQTYHVSYRAMVECDIAVLALDGPIFGEVKHFRQMHCVSIFIGVCALPGDSRKSKIGHMVEHLSKTVLSCSLRCRRKPAT